LAIWYTERLSEAGASSSVGLHGNSYDSTLAECVNGPWRALEQVELATQNGSIAGTTKRLHSAIRASRRPNIEALNNREHQAREAT
jgi:hypothetical protein